MADEIPLQQLSLNVWVAVSVVGHLAALDALFSCIFPNEKDIILTRLRFKRPFWHGDDAAPTALC